MRVRLPSLSMWGSNSVGRVCALHAQSRRFESDLLHRDYISAKYLWDEAAVACQFHTLNVEGSNPSPTIVLIWWNGRHGGLKIHSLFGVSVRFRGWVAGMVELADTLDLGSNGLRCASSSLVTCKSSLFRLRVGHCSF